MIVNMYNENHTYLDENLWWMLGNCQFGIDCTQELKLQLYIVFSSDRLFSKKKKKKIEDDHSKEWWISDNKRYICDSAIE